LFFSDPRTRDWFLIPSPISGASIIIGYLYFVLSWGPKYMEHRKPYQLKNTLVVYNFLQILISIWLFWEGLTGAWLNSSYNWRCEPVDFSYSPHALRVRKMLHSKHLIISLLNFCIFLINFQSIVIYFRNMFAHCVLKAYYKLIVL